MQHFNKHFKILLAFLAIFSSTQAQDFEWVKQIEIYNNGLINKTRPPRSVVDDSGNVYTAGSIQGDPTNRYDFNGGTDSFMIESNGSFDGFVTKRDDKGDFKWAIKIGGTRQDYTMAIVLDSAQNLYVGGVFNDTLIVNTEGGETLLWGEFNNARGQNAYIAKINSQNGAIEWIKQIGKGGSMNWISGLLINKNNEMILIGTILRGPNYVADYDPGSAFYNIPIDSTVGTYIASYSLDGSFNWGKSLNKALCLDAALNSNDDIILVGSFTGIADFDPSTNIHLDTAANTFAYFVLSLDKEANFQWVNKLQASNTQTYHHINMSIDRNNNIILGGGHNRNFTFDRFNFTNTGGTTVTPYLIKMDEKGKYLWAHSYKSFGSHNTNQTNSVATDYCGNIYITGEIRNAYVDFSSDSSIIDTIGFYNPLASGCYVVKYSPDGQLEWANKLNDAPWGSEGYLVTVGNNNNLYVQGMKEGNIDFNFDTNNSNTLSEFGFFTAKYSCGATSNPETINEEICDGAAFIFDQDTLSIPGSYTKHFCNISRCDSIVTLNLSFSELTEPLITVSEKTLSTSDEYASYQWMLDGNIIPGATNATYIVTENGKYQVIISTDKGCVDTSDKYIVNNANNIENLNGANAITVYPNPAKTAVQFVHHTGFNNSTIKLINVVGQTIITTNSVSGKSFQMDVQNLSSGVYIAEITDSDKTYRKSIVKE